MQLLAPFSPEYAPIEMLFYLLKRRFIDRSDDGLIKLNTNKGIELIEENMKTISEEVIWFWIKTTRNKIWSIS